MPAALMYSAIDSAALKWMNAFCLVAVALEVEAQRRLVAVRVEV
jgi:hypothetical protein